MDDPTPRPRIPIYFNKHYSSPSIAFETFKKSSAIAEAINSEATLRVCLDVCNPAPSESDLHLAREEIERYVDMDYREAVRTGIPATLAASNGLGWDENLWNSVLHSTAGVLRAINDVASCTPVAASLSSGLHHATPSHGSGFCTINSVALGALAAARGGLKIVILDLDAHCGGGTEAFLKKFPHEAEKIVHVDLSVIPFDRYEPRATGSWSRMATRDSYLADLDQALTMVLAEKPDLVIYNAGIDIWPTVDKQVVHERETRVAQTIVSNGIGCVIVMAGGYGSDDDIVPLHLSTLQSFARASSRAEDVKSLLAMSMTGPIPSIEPSSRTRIWAASARAGQDSWSRNRWNRTRGTIPIRFRPPIIHGWINLD
jgi:acetoin utilization deacetylase AcuC-like enzyme